MGKSSDRTISFKDNISAAASAILFVFQIIIGVYLLPEVLQIDFLAYAGVALYFFSGIVFGTLPVFEFRKNGGVQKDQSYIHTTKLVDTGMYSIVRHPQYVTYILFSISGMLLFQHWVVILIGIPIIPLTYFDAIRADKTCTEKFGDVYKAYMKKVPRANFLLGIIRKIRSRENKKQSYQS